MKCKFILIVLVIGVLISGCSQEKEAPPTGEEEPEPGFEWFQTGNIQSITQLQPKQSKELEDNRIGQMASLEADIHTEEDAERFVFQNTDLGMKWVRLSADMFDWNEVEDTGLYSAPSVDPSHDKAVTALVDNGIKIMYTLVYWDEEIQAEEGYSRFKTEEEIQRYLDYVQFIVNHFKDCIEYYEILNEPNVRDNMQQDVEVAEYINLVEQTVPVIREEYPEAKIVVGAVTPLFDEELGAREYFFSILSSDIMPLVDAVSWHVGAASLDYKVFRQYYYDYPSLAQEINDVASSHGFKGEFIAEELVWRTPVSASPHNPGYTLRL